MEELNRLFRPEFLNRIDEIILFRALTKEHLYQVVDLQLNSLKKRLAERNIEIEVTQEAKGEAGGGGL